MRVLVTGALGMLGSDLGIVLSGGTSWDLVLTDMRDGVHANGRSVSVCSICEDESLDDVFRASRPDWVINCAAFTAVDKAQVSSNAAFEINAIGPQKLAHAAKRHGAKLFHISTDYVFGHGIDPGQKRAPFKEEDKLEPCGIYGHSKRMGEELIREVLGDRSCIVRTSWLHGIYGPNFIDTMLRLGPEKKQLRIVDDQFGSPTWTVWLSQVIRELISANASGVFHASSRGNINWLDFAREIFRQANMSVEVLAQTTQDLNRPAPRPHFSTLDVSKLEHSIGKPCIDWKDSIAGHLKASSSN